MPERKLPVLKNEEFPDIADVYMSDATQTITSTEGKVLGPATPSTDADRTGAVAAPGMDDAKRRKVIPQSKIQDLRGSTLDFLKQIISSESGCSNCMSNDHKLEDCPNEGAAEWMRMLVGVHDGIVTRSSTADTEMTIVGAETAIIVEDDAELPETKAGFISFHDVTRSLKEIIGEEELASVLVGGKDPKRLGFRRINLVFDEISKHVKATQFIPQIDHVSKVDQNGMGKYANWTTQLQYGKVVALEAGMAVFVDPAWGDRTFNTANLGRNYNHSTLQNYTRRWSKVLRHDIGHCGRSARCDELGWVSIEEFIRNDHAWPLGDRKAYNARTNRYDEGVLRERRDTLMEGYWYTLNCRLVKRRMMIAVQMALPSEMQRILQIENPDIYNADSMARCSGFVRPVAIRATSGHSFSGDHKFRLDVNIDF